MKKITEQKCAEKLYKIAGIYPKKIISNKQSKIEDTTIKNFDAIVLDDEDLETALFGRDFIMNATIKADSYKSALEQVNRLVNDLKSKNSTINILDGVLVYFTTNRNADISKLTDIMQIIYTAEDGIKKIYGINTLWGNMYDNSLKDDYVKIGFFTSYKKQTSSYANIPFTFL